ncbi:hypothetical protein [Accumulibacter sp.]|uniref:hypothetical protein n=1 Tax=Accumulibacter sp. TaxID=2053492 RepID=UPI0025F406B7|nr:hypothetical protein [Accumulibacter sp.]MCP5228629.1 hypothetical protein [Accumulibacter sp.]
MQAPGEATLRRSPCCPSRSVVLLAISHLIRRSLAAARAADSRSRQLKAVIAGQGSAKLKSYPYQFRILTLTGETAFISTPRCGFQPNDR